MAQLWKVHKEITTLRNNIYIVEYAYSRTLETEYLK